MHRGGRDCIIRNVAVWDGNSEKEKGQTVLPDSEMAMRLSERSVYYQLSSSSEELPKESSMLGKVSSSNDELLLNESSIAERLS